MMELWRNLAELGGIIQQTIAMSPIIFQVRALWDNYSELLLYLKCNNAGYRTEYRTIYRAGGDERVMAVACFLLQ